MKTTTCIIHPAFVLFAFACFALSPTARATCQDGCLTGDNTVLGDDALLNNTGVANTAMGSHALFSSNTGGGDNTATGAFALYNTQGEFNTGTGAFALYYNTSGAFNTATGHVALYSNTTGSYNTATGDSALLGNTTGGGNTATGEEALEFNTTGSSNTATGASALIENTTGNDNTAAGVDALYDNTIGSDNTATGFSALIRNRTGNRNTATGFRALFHNKTGSSNIALGFEAGIGVTTGSNNIDIGNGGVTGESNTIRIGTVGDQAAAFVAGISGAMVASGVGVIIDTNGQLGTIVSSERFKEAVRPMDKASEAILALRPVSFRYKHDLDPEGIPQFGLVAEQVEKVNPDLVARDHEGKPYSVRYEAVNAMLLNEFLKEHKKVEEQQKEIDALKAELKEQTSLIHKVSAQIELSKSAPQTVSYNH